MRYSADVREFDGEPVVAIWSTPADGRGDIDQTGLAEVWRCRPSTAG